LAATSLLIPGIALANRPLQTEDAYTATYRHVELETSWDHASWANGDRDDILLVVTNYGATKRLEFSLETPMLVHRPDSGSKASGFGDVNLVSKFQVLPESASRPAVLFKGFFKQSNAEPSNGLGAGYSQYGLAAVGSRDFGPVILHATFGYALNSPNAVDRVGGVHFYGVATDVRLTERVRGVAEITGGRRVERDGLADPLAAFIGGVLRLSENLSLDAGLRRGLSLATPRWQTTLGLFSAF